MNNAVKRENLLWQLQSMLEHKQYKKEIEELLQALNVSKQQLIEGLLFYDLDMFVPEWKDKIFASIPIRIVIHIRNLIKDSWHIERQQIMVDFIKIANPKSIIDIGFGVPSQYTKELVLQDQLATLTLLDCYDEAFTFAESLLNIWDSNWQTKIAFNNMNMDDKKFVGKYDLYILQDAVEHTIDPIGFLTKQIKLSDPNAFFLLSLPIGPIIPVHYYAWATDQEAVDWVESCGLEIIQRKTIYVNPIVDLFADQVGDDFHDFYLLCRKK